MAMYLQIRINTGPESGYYEMVVDPRGQQRVGMVVVPKETETPITIMGQELFRPPHVESNFNSNT